MKKQNSIKMLRRQASVASRKSTSKEDAAPPGLAMRRSSSRISKQSSMMLVQNGPPDLSGSANPKSLSRSGSLAAASQSPESKRNSGAVKKRNMNIDIALPQKRSAAAARSSQQKLMHHQTVSFYDPKLGSFVQQSGTGKRQDQDSELQIPSRASRSASYSDEADAEVNNASVTAKRAQPKRKTATANVVQRREQFAKPKSRSSIAPSGKSGKQSTRKRDAKAQDKASASAKKSVTSKSFNKRSQSLNKQKSNVSNSSASRKKKAAKKDKKTDRTRKSQCQKDTLWEWYKQLDGEPPNREIIAQLSEHLNLKENQIYKWFWDTKKKVKEVPKLAKNISMSNRRAEFQKKKTSASFYQDENGFLKPKEKECIDVEGKDGLGERMTPQQIKTALKIHQLAAEKEADFESIAQTLGIDIEKMAQEMIACPSPTNRRQTVRKVNANSSLGSMSAAPSFNLKMMKPSLNLESQQQSFSAISKSGGTMTNKARQGFNSVRNLLSKQQDQQQKQLGRTPLARMARQSSGFTGAAGRAEQNSLREQYEAPIELLPDEDDDQFFQQDPNFVQKYQSRTKVGNAFEKNSIKPSEDEILESPAPMTRQRSLLRQGSITKQQSFGQPPQRFTFGRQNSGIGAKQMVSPLLAQQMQRKKISNRLDSALFDRDNLIMSDDKKEDGNNVGLTPKNQQAYNRVQAGNQNAANQEEEGLMRQNTVDMFKDEFEQMLQQFGQGSGAKPMTNHSPDRPANQPELTDLQRQASIGLRSMLDYIEPRADTGTTPGRDYANLFMNRNANFSIEQRPEYNLISPNLVGNSKHSIHMPTPLRRNGSILIANSIAPNFGGAGPNPFSGADGS